MDFKFAWRSMIRNPGFAALVIVTMALGIGASTSMFSVIRAVFLRGLPFPNQDRIVTLWENDAQHGVSQRRVTPANFVDWESQSSVFEEIGALPNWTGPTWPFNIVGRDGMERVQGLYASSGFFRTLGVAPALGHTFGRDEDRKQGERTVVLSYSYWKTRLGGDPNILGKALDVDTFRGGAFTIIGVMPETFDFPHGTQIWLSLGDWGAGPMPPPDAAERCCAWYAVFARLKPGVTVERAQAEMTVLARRISQRHPEASTVTDVSVIPLRERMVGAHRLGLFALFGAVACVLLIGCANVANLLLSRGVTRRRELLTRMAVGASHGRIARQLIAESLLLTGSGALAGVLLAVWLFEPLARTALQKIPFIEETRADSNVLAFSLLLTILSGVVCGVAPMLGLRNADWRSRRQADNPASRRLRKTLVVGEVALAVMLVAGAGLLVRTVANLQAVDPGFRPQGILVVSTDLTTGPLRERGQAAKYLEALLPRLSALPGVRLAAAATRIPMQGDNVWASMSPEGRPILPTAQSPQNFQGAVTPSYFNLMGISLLKGRLFNESDTSDAKLVAIVNETAAKRIWPGEDVIGKRFTIGSSERLGRFRPTTRSGEIEWHEVVGVVSDVRTVGFDAAAEPEVFYNYQQYPIYDPKVLLQTEGDPLTLAAAVRAEAAAVNNRAVISGIQTMTQVTSESITEPRYRAALVALFSAMALALAALGIYGVMSYTVAQRTQEIGIRKALGARDAQVSRMILSHTLRLAAAGIALGLACAFAVAHWISSLLFQVAPSDPGTIAATCILLSGAALLAGYLPARRALRVDPAVALRSE